MIETSTIRDLRTLPKVHVHAHLDGSFTPSSVEALARRQGRDFSPASSFRDVDRFFEAYGTVPALVRRSEDLVTLCTAMVEAEAAAGVLFLEPAIEPQLYAPRLGSLREVTEVIVGALQAAARTTGIQVGANLTVNTDVDEALAAELASIAASLAGRGITAFGTAGFVEPAGLHRFQESADIARSAGLPVVAHAGQTGGPESIREALDVLGATRISHGFRAAEDPALLTRLARDGIVCDVCPVSNVALGLVADLRNHPARILIDAGVPVTLNADDSLWFGQDVTDQWRIARGSWGLSDADVAEVARAGLRIDGMSPTTRSIYEDALAAWSTAAPGRHRIRRRTLMPVTTTSEKDTT